MDNIKYAALEDRGFKTKYFPRNRGSKPARYDRHIGKRFRVVARVYPMNNDPMWVIEFEDGFRMAANVREVIA